MLAEGLVKYGNKQARGAIVKEPPSCWNIHAIYCRTNTFAAFTVIVQLYVWLQTVRKLVFALLVCLCFMVVEFCGGYFTHRHEQSAYDLLHIAKIALNNDSVHDCSLALMTDAAHLLSDVTGFAVAAVASHLAGRKSARTYSFGSVMADHEMPLVPFTYLAVAMLGACRYHRAEVLGALMSVLIIWVVTGVLIYEATLRIITPGHTKGKGQSSYWSTLVVSTTLMEWQAEASFTCRLYRLHVCHMPGKLPVVSFHDMLLVIDSDLPCSNVFLCPWWHCCKLPQLCYLGTCTQAEECCWYVK